MRQVGFITEHDAAMSSTLFKDAFGRGNNDPVLINKILEFLSKGTLIMAWMGYFKDLETNAYAEPHAYYSDGIWLWPSYFPYYIRKHSNYNLDVDFVAYLIGKNFLIADLPPDAKDKLERDLIDKIR